MSSSTIDIDTVPLATWTSQLLRKLSDAALASVVAALVTACHGRTACAVQLQRTQQELSEARANFNATEELLSAAPLALATDVRPGEVRGMDVEVATSSPGKKWSLAFGTPIYQAQFNADALNAALMRLLDAEPAHRRLPSGRSLEGSGWRTNDEFLKRTEPVVAQLQGLLHDAASSVVQYGQFAALNVHVSVRGWAVVLHGGGSMREHVHPRAAWTGIYYVATDGVRADHSGSGSGCLTLTDPRPAASMVSMGPNDAQFRERRTVCPTPGTLLMFPAWLPHAVTPTTASDGAADGARVAVAFNVFAAEHGFDEGGDAHVAAANDASKAERPAQTKSKSRPRAAKKAKQKAREKPEL